MVHVYFCRFSVYGQLSFSVSCDHKLRVAVHVVSAVCVCVCSDDLLLEDEEGDPMDDPEISAGEKSGEPHKLFLRSVVIYAH